MLFLIGAGVPGGAGFLPVLQSHGAVLFLYGALLTAAPMICGYFFAARVLKMRLLNSLGAITGGMTSTPALGTLIRVAGTGDVAAAVMSSSKEARGCLRERGEFERRCVPARKAHGATP